MHEVIEVKIRVAVYTDTTPNGRHNAAVQPEHGHTVYESEDHASEEEARHAAVSVWLAARRRGEER